MTSKTPDSARANVAARMSPGAPQGGPVHETDPSMDALLKGEISVVESLSRWAMSHRRLTVLAHNFEHVQRRHPRWATWRRQWSHIVSCRSLPDIEPGRMPTLWLAPRLLAVRLFDVETVRGSVSSEASDVQHGKELLDALLQHSVEAFPVTTLGL